jgi:hypothetical protein
MFRHPKYYKELRKLRNKLDQAISLEDSTESVCGVRPDPGPKRQASSGKPQAASLEKQASSPEEQASSRKP